jgi:hypothetical protein
MKMACWLMEHFAVEPALIGDIVEAAPQHSAVGFCVEVLVAVLRAAVRDVRHYPVRNARAVVIGWLMFILSRRALWPVEIFLAPWMFELNFLLRPRWLRAFPVEYAVVTVVGALIVGFTVSRLHRPRSMTAALSYVVTMLLVDAAVYLPRLVESLIADFLPMLVLYSLVFVVVPITTLIGALVGAGPGVCLDRASVQQRRTDALRIVVIAVVSSALALAWLEGTKTLYIWFTNSAVISWASRWRPFMYAWQVYGGPLYPLWCAGSFLLGWSITRNRRRGFSGVLVTLAAQWPLLLYFSLPYWRGIFGPNGDTVFTAPWSWPVALYRSGWWIAALMPILAVPACTLLGGLLAGPYNNPVHASPRR